MAENEVSVSQIAVWFEDIWKRYPSKVAKKAARRSFFATSTETGVRTGHKWKRINEALKKYLQTERVKQGYIQNGRTWFANWTDWLEYEEPKPQPWGSDFD